MFSGDIEEFLCFSGSGRYTFGVAEFRKYDLFWFSLAPLGDWVLYMHFICDYLLLTAPLHTPFLLVYTHTADAHL